MIESERANAELKTLLEAQIKITAEWEEKFEKCNLELTMLQDSLKKKFHADQIKILTGSSHINWSDEMISEALAVKLRCGNNGLDFIAQNYVPLPTSRTVNRHLESWKFTAGIQKLNLKILKLKCNRLPKHQRFFQIVFDEKSITPGSFYDRSTKSHLGISTLDPTEAHLKNNPEAIATHVLVFQVVGLTTRFKEIACIEFTAGATKGISLWEKLKSVIEACEREVGIEILSVAMDMNNDNVSMLSHAGVNITSRQQNYFFTHPFDSTRIIFVKPDDVHNIKNMICGFRKKNIVLDTSLVAKNNLSSNIATFNDVINVYEKQKGATFKSCPKLTQKVIEPTHFDKMREKVNDVVFSQDVIDAIKDQNQGEKENCTAFVLKCFNKFHHITYSKGWSIENRDAYESDLKFLEFIHKEFFPNIKFVANEGRNTFKRSLYAAITSTKTLIDLSKYLFAQGCPNVVPAYLLSNSIENLFSLAVARSKKQNAVQMKNTFKTITLSNHQEELTNYGGSYSLERNEVTHENQSFLRMIKEESKKENAAKIEMDSELTANTCFYEIPAVINPEKVFKNAMEMKAFAQESEKFLRDMCKSKECEIKRLLFGEDGKITPEAKTLLLQLEFAFRKVLREISLSSKLFSLIFFQFAQYFEDPYQNEKFRAELNSNFLEYRHLKEHSSLSLPEAARLASRSQV